VSRQIDEWAFEALKAGGVLADGESTTEPPEPTALLYFILFSSQKHTNRA
jgi:hypothetical protein